MTNADSKIAVLKEKTDALEKDHDALARSVNGSLKDIWKAVNGLRTDFQVAMKEVREENAEKFGLPMVLLIAFLSSLCVGLIVHVVSMQ